MPYLGVRLGTWDLGEYFGVLGDLDQVEVGSLGEEEEYGEGREGVVDVWLSNEQAREMSRRMHWIQGNEYKVVVENAEEYSRVGPDIDEHLGSSGNFKTWKEALDDEIESLVRGIRKDREETSKKPNQDQFPGICPEYLYYDCTPGRTVGANCKYQHQTIEDFVVTWNNPVTVSKDQVINFLTSFGRILRPGEPFSKESPAKHQGLVLVSMELSGQTKYKLIKDGLPLLGTKLYGRIVTKSREKKLEDKRRTFGVGNPRCLKISQVPTSINEEDIESVFPKNACKAVSLGLEGSGLVLFTSVAEVEKWEGRIVEVRGKELGLERHSQTAEEYLGPSVARGVSPSRERYQDRKLANLKSGSGSRAKEEVFENIRPTPLRQPRKSSRSRSSRR